MGEYLAYWGVPDFGVAVRRTRVAQVLAQASSDIRLLVAPSGWGKTIAAAHYAESSGYSVLWLDMFGTELEVEHLVLCLSQMLGAVDPGTTEALDSRAVARLLAARQDRVMIVVDDATLRGDALRQLSAVQRRLSVAGAQLVVTSRACDDPRGVPGIALVGVPDLKLTQVEAQELEALLGGGSQDGAPPAALKHCDGHIALFAVMTGSSILGMESNSNPRMESWIRRLLEQSLTDGQCALIQCAALVRHGFVSELRALVPECEPDDLVIRFPLFRVVRESIGTKFVVHDSALEALLDDFGQQPASLQEHHLKWAIGLLEQRRDDARIAELLLKFGDSERNLSWLKALDGEVVERVPTADLLSVIDSVPLHAVMGSPSVVALWARSLHSAGDDEGAIAKAKAACHLAEHLRDFDTLAESHAIWIDALCRLQRYEEAAELAETTPPEGGLAARISRLAARATVLMYMGRLGEAQAVLEQALELVEGVPGQTQESLRLVHARHSVRVLASGDWSRWVKDLSSLLPKADQWRSDGLRLRGNLALGLLETGRLSRSLAIMDSLIASAPSDIAAPYLFLRGAALLGLGNSEHGIAVLQQALCQGLSHGYEGDTAANRIYVAATLRAIGDLQGALSQAERAFEYHCVVDYEGYRSLATIEVSASLLSLGDVAGARRWLEVLEAEGLPNRYHALRAAMVLAECDRRDGNLQAGIDRLSSHRDHILSESSNWQMAMYVRAFPGLLGMLAAAIGAGALPIHMLRMVLPEYAETALGECKSWLDHDQWRELGGRLLGEAEFARTEQRGDQRPCRVRLFGGLDVVVSDHSIAERDWRKRKARLLFAMLVAKRGQEVPRDQVLEYLWPELPEERARNNFYVAWSSMKRALMGPAERSEACPYLENKGGRLRIKSDTVRSDIDDFEDALAEARDAEGNDEARRAIEAYGRLSTIYRGDLLPGDLYDDWFSALRDRCRFDFVDAMVRAAELLLECDEPCEALAYARRAQQVDPLREDLYQVVMRCSIAAGQRNTAIDAFLQLRAKLSDDLGLDPSAESMALYQQILVMENSPRYDDYGLS